MGTVHLQHIRRFLTEHLVPYIDVSDIIDRSKAQQEEVSLTRSLAALAIFARTDLDYEQAAETVVDGFDDNGIDALHYDIDQDIVYLVQAKWKKTGRGGLSRADVQKFVAGFKDLLTSKSDRFNGKIQAQWNNVQAALENPSVRFKLICIHTGVSSPSQHILDHLDDLITEQNDVSDVVDYEIVGQASAHELVARTVKGNPIDLTVMVKEWGVITDPFLSYYGRVDITEIGTWYKNHGNSIFNKNLRKFIPSSDINHAIRDSLLEKPNQFWYLNNGITVICNRVEKTPLGGNDRKSGVLECRGVSIVNGAQTVGSIASALAAKSTLEGASVLVRFISLENTPEHFSSDITRATNTQNRIVPRDFASLDPQQTRLQQDLFLENGKTYSFHTGDPLSSKDEGCTIDEAAVALACRRNIELTVRAKSYVSGLYDEIDKPPYTILFNEKLSARKMWNLVQISRIVEDALAEFRDNARPEARLPLVHGNRFIQHIVLQAIPEPDLEEPEMIAKWGKKNIKAATREAAACVVDTMRLSTGLCMGVGDHVRGGG